MKIVEEFVEEARKRVAPGEFIIAYNSIPLMFYLTETRSFLGDIWPTMHGKEVVKGLLKKAESKNPPRFVFRAITNTQSEAWGNNQIIPPHNKEMSEAVMVIDAWVAKKGYRIAWKNRDFLILEKAN